jgi:hypothetical protein
MSNIYGVYSPLNILNTTTSTTTTTGALIVSGGVGVSGAINATSVTLTTPLAVTSGGSGSSTSTGSGSLVLNTSPTLVTPVLGAATGTSLSVSGQLISTVATGTAPLVVASTTNVPNLNASTLSGNTFASPGPIGGTTPSTGAFTTLNLNQTSPIFTVEIKATNAGDTMRLNNTNSLGYATIRMQNDTGSVGYIGVGGSASGFPLANQLYLSSPGSILLRSNTEINGTLLASDIFTMYPNSGSNSTIKMFGGYGHNWNIAVNTFGGGGNNVYSPISIISDTGAGVYMQNSSGWSNNSDRSLKKNISNMDTSIAHSKVLKLNPVKYHFIKENKDSDLLKPGLIAQDLIDIIPEIVTVNNNKQFEKPKLGICYQELIPYLISSIQELQSQITKIQDSL